MLLLLGVIIIRSRAKGPSSGDGLFLEDGTSYLLLENGDFLLLE